MASCAAPWSSSVDADEAEIRAAALALPKVAEAVGSRKPRNVIVVPNRIVNVVV